MRDVRAKICTESRLHEPELLELLVAGKIVGMDLPINLVYEKIWWPSLCRIRNPDEYDIPNIADAQKNQLAPMEVTYRLAGVDGEATEDRIDALDAEDNENDEKN